MKDSYGRSISYLRISVTDKCNLRCLYCMPEEGPPAKAYSEILRYEEILDLIKCWAGLGLSKIRLTGGEPLVRRGICDFIRQASRIPGVKELTLTTNGILLRDYARELKDAGVHRVNISIDSLNPEKFKAITRGGKLEKVWSGIYSGLENGLTPIKINVVVIRGFNDDELFDFVKVACEYSLEVRFIELMPLGGIFSEKEWRKKFISTAEVKSRLERRVKFFPLEVEGSWGSGPAELFNISAGKPRGVIGFISPVSGHFCDHCNRLRLTADGKIRLCLRSHQEINVRDILRQGAGEEDLKRLLLLSLKLKPRGYVRNPNQGERIMSEIGG